MIELAKTQENKVQRYISKYNEFEEELKKKEPAWLYQIRKEAISRFNETGFPAQRDEEWRHTNIKPILDRDFNDAEPTEVPDLGDLIKHVSFEKADFIQIVFVNGYFSTELSRIESLPDGVSVQNLASAIEQDSNRLEPYLSRMGSYENHPFAALNTAFFKDGAYVHIRNGVIVDRPIHILFVSTSPEEALVSYPRTLVVAGRESQVTLIESYAGTGSERCLTNAVTEISAGENAFVDHYKLQRESQETFHIANMLFYMDRNSNFSSHSISFGGEIVRNDINAILGDEGIECMLNGLCVALGKQHVDNHTYLDHAKPNCNSHELYKNILDDKSSGVFKGKILVQRDAQKTDAKQTNMNLLLSDDAIIDTMPQLEIYADDVKCTHGATTGQLDKDALFYLRSRGIPEESAKHLLTFAFANDIVSRIKVPEVHDQLESLLHDKLPFESHN